MKKWILIILISFCVMTGCSDTSSYAQIDIYKNYYQAISEMTKFEEESDYYTLSGEIQQSDSGTYLYYIILDDPKIAMYDVVMMAVENHIAYESSVKMMPSIGIFDDTYSLIPNQVNKEAGYAKGIVISGETDSESVSLNLVVEWKDKNKAITSRIFHSILIDSSGLQFVDESAVS